MTKQNGILKKDILFETCLFASWYLFLVGTIITLPRIYLSVNWKLLNLINVRGGE